MDALLEDDDCPEIIQVEQQVEPEENALEGDLAENGEEPDAIREFLSSSKSNSSDIRSWFSGASGERAGPDVTEELDDDDDDDDVVMVE